MLLSTVTNTSNCASARRNNSPLCFPAHPACGTVFTSCPVSSWVSTRGRHSSMSTRTLFRGLEKPALGFLKKCDHLFSRHRGEVIQKPIDAVAGFQIINEGLRGYA